MVGKHIKRTKEELANERYEIAKKFSEDVVKKLGQTVKAVITWGSVTRKSFTKKSDIDCLVIVDDTSTRITDQIREKMDDEIVGIARSTDKRISVQPVWFLSEFWDMIRNQSPLAYSVLREGWALYDTGFFIPLRKLYEMGSFPSTSKSAQLKMESAPRRIDRAEKVKTMLIFEDIFYAMLETAQTVIGFIGKEPPGIRNSPMVVRDYFVKTGMLEESYAKDLEDVVKFHKAVEHGETKSVSGQELDMWIEKSRKFVARFEELLKVLENQKKAESINSVAETLWETSLVALKTLDKLPKDAKEVPEAVQRNLVQTGMVNVNYSGLLEKVLSMKRMTQTNEVGKISESEIDVARDYVHRFAVDLRRSMRK
jgi:predicted nucleotidyltransferase